MNPDWRLADSLKDRLSRLLDPINTLDRISESLRKHMIVCARWEWGSDPELHGRARVSFELQVDVAVYDVFFNGWDGYRAQYYRSVVAGIAANVVVLSSLRPQLVSAAQSWGLFAPAPGFPVNWRDLAREDVARSLSDDGAKIWISEHELTHIEPQWQSGVPRHEILAPRWVQNVDHAVSEEKTGTWDRQPALIAGTRAFLGERLGVRGAFIVPGARHFPAVVPCRKHGRAKQIHDYGFA